MPKRKIKNTIIQAIRRLTVVAAATLIIVSYVYLLNFFGNVYGAGQGWDNPLLWFGSAMSALIVVVAISWILTKLVRWLAASR